MTRAWGSGFTWFRAHGVGSLGFKVSSLGFGLGVPIPTSYEL